LEKNKNIFFLCRGKFSITRTNNKQMNDNNQYDELLVKYLADDLNTEEKAFVETWIHTNEQNRIYFEELQSAWNLTVLKNTLEKVNVNEEWNHFRQTITPTSTKVIPLHQEHEKNRDDEKEPEQQRKSLVFRILVRTAIAASVLFVIGLGWIFFFNNKAETPVVQHTQEKKDSVLFVVHHEVNTTGKQKRIQLPDGSLIVLADNGEISYREPFTNRRDITLIGKAFFKVAHDKERPFTVFSGAISTTALGTEFTVTALEKANQIIVRLYEGKVVVKAVDKGDRKLKKDVYLLPGQAFVYGSQTDAKVKKFKANNTSPEAIINNELSSDHPSLPQDIKGSWYMFNNQSLADVFDQLSAIYKVKIAYEKKDIENIYFTGKYNQSDSLESILKDIAILHSLTITKKDNEVIVSK
jgi:transmembrane sensor